MKWYKQAANHGHTDAQFNLGVAYANGNGVSRSLILAHVWFTLAADSGLEHAARNRDLLERRMQETEIREARASKAYLMNVLRRNKQQ